MDVPNTAPNSPPPEPGAPPAARALRPVPDPPAQDLTGQRLGHFHVDGVIGRGGMSTLYRATDTRLGRRVALKVIDEGLAADPEFRDRFADEARNTSAIDHSHVVPLYDFDETDGHLYIAMRYVEGPDLAQVIDRRPLAPTRTIRLLAQVADALDAVHSRGLVHLDVKPANVLVTTHESAAGEHAYLADFGLTRRGRTGHRTSNGDFLGSPTYAAPEHLRGDPVHARSDVYALTCVLFTCLTGRAPYLGSVTQVIDGHLTGRVPAASAICASGSPGITPHMDAVVRRGMHPDPQGRFASGPELVDAARIALHAPVPGTSRALAVPATAARTTSSPGPRAAHPPTSPPSVGSAGGRRPNAHLTRSSVAAPLKLRDPAPPDRASPFTTRRGRPRRQPRPPGPAAAAAAAVVLLALLVVVAALLLA